MSELKGYMEFQLSSTFVSSWASAAPAPDRMIIDRPMADDALQVHLLAGEAPDAHAQVDFFLKLQTVDGDISSSVPAPNVTDIAIMDAGYDQAAPELAGKFAGGGRLERAASVPSVTDLVLDPFEGAGAHGRPSFGIGDFDLV